MVVARIDFDHLLFFDRVIFHTTHMTTAKLISAQASRSC